MIRFDTFIFDYDTKNVIVFSRVVVVLLVRHALLQRFGAWCCGGFLALLFIRSTNVESCTNVSKKYVTRH